MSEMESRIWACKNCHGVFSNGRGKSECPRFPGGGGCDPEWDGSTQLALHASPAEEGQPGWTLCRKCKGLFFAAENPAGGVCPLGGAHERIAEVDFTLSSEGAARPWSGARGYRWCKNCQAMFLWFPNQAQQGECPSFPGGGGHDGNLSSHYEIQLADDVDALPNIAARVGDALFAGHIADLRRPRPIAEGIRPEIAAELFRPVDPGFREGIDPAILQEIGGKGVFDQPFGRHSDGDGLSPPVGIPGLRIDPSDILGDSVRTVLRPDAGMLGILNDKLGEIIKAREEASHSAASYRDYLVGVYAHTSGKTVDEARTLLGARYHQSFATTSTLAKPAAELAAAVLERALPAAPPHGLGIALGTLDRSTPRALLDALVARSGLAAGELERRYHVRLGRSDGETSTAVDENIHALQRFLSDDWQGETEGEAQSIVVASKRVPPFYLFHDEWLDQQRPFFPENHIQLTRCYQPRAAAAARETITAAQTAIAAMPDAGYLRQKDPKTLTEWYKRREQLLGAQLDLALQEGHEAMALGQPAVAQSQYREAMRVLQELLSLWPDFQQESGRFNWQFLLSNGELVALSRQWRRSTDVAHFKLGAHWFLDTVGPTATAALGPRKALPATNVAEVRRLEQSLLQSADVRVAQLHLAALGLPALLGDAAFAHGDYAEAVHQYMRALPWSVVVGLGVTDAADSRYLFHGDLPFTYMEPYEIRAGYHQEWVLAQRGYGNPMDASRLLENRLHHPVEEVYFRLRLGHAMIEWADELHRRGGESGDGRARELYKAVLLVHGEDPGVTGRWPGRPEVKPPPMSRRNPAARGQIERARLGLSHIDAGLNWFGFDRGTVPILRYGTLRDAAMATASAARTAQADLFQYLTLAGDWLREHRKQETLAQRAEMQARIAGEQRALAMSQVTAAKDQVAAVEAAIKAKRAEIDDHDGLGAQFVDFFSGMAGAVSGLVKGGKEAAGVLGVDTASVGAGAKGALGLGGEATLAGGAAVMAGYGLFVYAGYTSMSGLAGAANQRSADLRTLTDKTLPAAQAAVRARQREVTMTELLRGIADADATLSRDLVQITQLGAIGPSLFADMSNLARRLLQRYLDAGARLAWLAERALAYELGRDLSIIKTDYFPQERDGLGGADLLLSDLRALEVTRLDAARAQAPIKHTFSLVRDFPLAFAALRRDGRCRLHTTEDMLARAYPGTYGHRIVAVTVAPLTGDAVSPARGVLRNDGVSQVGDEEGRQRPSLRPADALPVSEFRLAADREVFGLPGESLMPFEGSGMDTFWELTLPAAANPQGLGTLSDVLVTVDVRAGCSASRPAVTASAQPAVLLSLTRNLSAPQREALLQGSTVELTADLGRVPGLDLGRPLVGVAVLLVGDGLSGDKAATIRPSGRAAVSFTLKNGLAFAHRTETAAPAGASIVASDTRLAALLGSPPAAPWVVSLEPAGAVVRDVLLLLEPAS